MKEILFKLPLAVYGLKLKNKECFHELAVEMLSWYQNITTGELTVMIFPFFRTTNNKQQQTTTNNKQQQTTNDDNKK